MCCRSRKILLRHNGGLRKAALSARLVVFSSLYTLLLKISRERYNEYV